MSVVLMCKFEFDFIYVHIYLCSLNSPLFSNFMNESTKRRDIFCCFSSVTFVSVQGWRRIYIKKKIFLLYFLKNIKVCSFFIVSGKQLRVLENSDPNNGKSSLKWKSYLVISSQLPIIIILEIFDHKN